MREVRIRRLTMYWKLEAFNVILVPAIVAGSVIALGGQITPSIVVSSFACSLLLVIGSLAWLIELKSIQVNRGFGQRWVPRLVAMKWCSIALCVAAAGTLIRDLQFKITIIEFGAAGVLTLLAVLEYVNYYHIQLQHFDHWSDFKRLITGRGFRKSHLAKAIEVHQKTSLSLQSN